ncbi:MAG: hypothetical protein D6701_13475, partial [Gemmatimonadetes bacterium]
MDAVRVALTLGDPRGVGPEVAFEALRRLPDLESGVAPVLVGPEAFADAARAAAGPSARWEGVEGGPDDEAAAGRAAGAAIERAAALALA